MLAVVPMHSLVAVEAICSCFEHSLATGDTNSTHCFSPETGRVSRFELHRQGG
jgi:hypothetical protein